MKPWHKLSLLLAALLLCLAAAACVGGEGKNETDLPDEALDEAVNSIFLVIF